MKNENLSDWQKSEIQLNNLLQEFQRGNIRLSVLSDYIMDNLSEKAISGLASDYDDSQEGQPLS